jgi:SNF2 family DNA or RNA helicase
VEAQGKLYREAGDFRIEVTSGIDWFELHGGATFGDQEVPLPTLLAALRRGEDLVPLGDGSFGLLPEEWLKKYVTLAGVGTPEGDHLRFRRTQVGLLDVLLAEQPEARFDKRFERARERLRQFQGVAPADPPAGFQGQLRGYQRDGLGWLHFLREFGFGGCLADDMGLGKTVQVLALLEARRALRAATRKRRRPPPSLVVVPRSLVFNWKEEAARFTPKLRVLDNTGIGRARPGEQFDKTDVILTTYGTLRKDIVDLKDYPFDYAILDEAQAIKNASSQSAKAARLIHAEHRLALSGTPVENHLGELWSLFEFLNPGMLGKAVELGKADVGLRKADEDNLPLLAKALRPFLLRRTKEQVAKDLPAKSEQTVYCRASAN